MTKENISICYLCGKELNKDINNDHIPPRQFYPSDFLKRYNISNLYSLPTHQKCNFAYKHDEDYFVPSFIPVINGSIASNAKFIDIARGFEKNPPNRILGKMILGEFEKAPSELNLPDGKMIKRFDDQRIHNIIWKITRGLFFKENKFVLPENTLRSVRIVPPDEKPPGEFKYLLNSPLKGEYFGVFCYKYKVIQELNNFNLFAILFWDKLLVLVGFHELDCSCDKCKLARK